LVILAPVVDTASELLWSYIVIGIEPHLAGLSDSGGPGTLMIPLTPRPPIQIVFERYSRSLCPIAIGVQFQQPQDSFRIDAYASSLAAFIVDAEENSCFFDCTQQL
jgi:hypothetical protein